MKQLLQVITLLALAIALTPLAARAQQPTYTTLYSFSRANGSGVNPSSPLIQGGDGNFYGTTYLGGTSNEGTIFEFDSTGTMTVLHNCERTDGAFPEQIIIGSDGNFYGTTSAGGKYNEGTAYKMSPTGDYTILHSFTKINGSSLVNVDGSEPSSPLAETDKGNFTAYATVAEVMESAHSTR